MFKEFYHFRQENLFNSLVFLDTQPEANHYMWQNNLNCRKKHPQKAGRAQITLEDLEEELKMKKEKIDGMQTCVDHLISTAKNEIIDEMDLAEYEELLATDEDESDAETSSITTAGKYWMTK